MSQKVGIPHPNQRVQHQHTFGQRRGSKVLVHEMGTYEKRFEGLKPNLFG